MKLALVLILLAALALPAAAQGPGVTVRYGPVTPSSHDLEDQRVPHHLGPMTTELASLSAESPVPAVLFTADGLVVVPKSDAGVLVVPHFANAGAQRVDDRYVYPSELGVLHTDLVEDTAALDRLVGAAAVQTGMAPRTMTFAPRSVPDLQLDLDLAEGAVGACAVDCGLPEAAQGLLASLAQPGAFARADGLAGTAALPQSEALHHLPLDFAAASPGVAPAPLERGAPLETQAAGPLPSGGAAADAAMLAAGALALGALLLAPFALYSKIRRDATLLNDTRRTVFESVAANPGLSIQEVARRATISHSTAAYHLDRLAGAGLVVATGDGNKVRYYRNGGRFTEQERKLLPCLENAETVKVLEAVLHRPWTYRAEVATLLGVTATTVNWHLKRLFGAGILSEVREGRSAYLFVDRPGLGAACAGLHEKTPDSPARGAAGRLLAHLGRPLPVPTFAGPVRPVAASALPAPLAAPGHAGVVSAAHPVGP